MDGQRQSGHPGAHEQSNHRSISSAGFKTATIAYAPKLISAMNPLEHKIIHLPTGTRVVQQPIRQR
jgi:hypothetical protein